MKNNYIIILILLFPLLFISCSDGNPTEGKSNKYNGTWLYLKSVGGIFPRVITPEDGVTIKIIYDYSNTFKIIRNDTLEVIAHYNIEEAEHDWNKIAYSNITTYNYNFNSHVSYARVNSDTLEIWDGAIDGFFSFYKKIN